MPQGDIHARGHTLASPRMLRASFPDNKFKVQLIIYVSLISPPFPYRRDEPLGRMPGWVLPNPVSPGPLHSAGAPLHHPPPAFCQNEHRLRAGALGWSDRVPRGQGFPAYPLGGWGWLGGACSSQPALRWCHPAGAKMRRCPKIRWICPLGVFGATGVLIMHHGPPYGAQWVPDG